MILAFYILFAAMMVSVLYPLHYPSTNWFFSELISRPIAVPYWLCLGSVVLNPILVYRIARRILPKHEVMAVGIYCLSVWPVYLAVAGSAFVVWLMFGLVGIWGVGNITNFWGRTGAIIGIVVLGYGSLVMLLVVVGSLLLTKTWKNQKHFLLVLMPLFLLMLVNWQGTVNVWRQQITLVPEYALAINDNFRGQTQQAGMGILSKIAENKWDFYAIYGLNKLLLNISWQSFFTTQVKLLGFSFAAPVFVGFLVPMIFGMIVLSKKWHYLVAGGLLLLTPSLLAEKSPSLERLVLIYPVIVYLIVAGWEAMRKQKLRWLSWLCVGLVVGQVSICIFDIPYREFTRYWVTAGKTGDFVIGR